MAEDAESCNLQQIELDDARVATLLPTHTVLYIDSTQYSTQTRSMHAHAGASTSHLEELGGETKIIWTTAAALVLRMDGWMTRLGA